MSDAILMVEAALILFFSGVACGFWLIVFYLRKRQR